MEPKIEEIPARCKEKIAKSVLPPGWPRILDNGGYKVQPAPQPLSTNLLTIIKIIEGSNNQKLILFRRGKAISPKPIIIGINQLPKPPIKIGITLKKIIINAWPVTIQLYNWELPKTLPGWPNSIRIILLIDEPIRPPHTP